MCLSVVKLEQRLSLEYTEHGSVISPEIRAMIFFKFMTDSDKLFSREIRANIIT